MSGQAARTSLLAAIAVGALAGAPAHAAKPPAATIPCAKSAPVGDAEVEKVVVGRDKRGWQMDEHHRNGGLSITRCDARGRFARSQEFMPVRVASGGTVLALIDEAQPWRAPDGSWGRLLRSAALAEQTVSKTGAAAIRRDPHRLHAVRRADRRFARSWGGSPKAKASDTFLSLPEGCSRPNDYSAGAFWHRRTTTPEEVWMTMVGSITDPADIDLRNVGSGMSWIIDNWWTDCNRVTDTENDGVTLGWWGTDFWPALSIRVSPTWAASAPTATYDGVTTLRWGRSDTLCNSTTAIGCTQRWVFRSGYLADADVVMLPDNSILPAYPRTTFTWAGLHDNRGCTAEQTFCADFQAALLHELLHALGLDHVTTSAQTMYPSAPRTTAGRTLGKGDLTGLTRIIYYP